VGDFFERPTGPPEAREQGPRPHAGDDESRGGDTCVSYPCLAREPHSNGANKNVHAATGLG